MTRSAIREIVYHFGDAPIPPEYHRICAITVTPDTVKIVVDSYGDILVEKVREITKDQFEHVVRSLDRNGITKSMLKEKQDEDCVGGTHKTVAYSCGESKMFSGTVYHCGGKDSEDLQGDVKSFADDLRTLVPDLEELLK